MKNRNDNIYLIGFMASGKSVIAQHLSKQLKITAIDLDQEIEKNTQKSITEIFKSNGESYFRQQEYLALKSVFNPKIVATGGGILTFKKSFNLLNNETQVIWLNASFETICSRLSKPEQIEKRPLADPLTLKDRYENRVSLYSNAANFSICVDNKSIAEITETILVYLNENN